MNNKLMFSSENFEWETPSSIYDSINEEYNFTLDVCATHDNAKVKSNYFTMQDDGLSKDWRNEICWMNPPYGKQIGKWIEKAFLSVTDPLSIKTKVVCLLPARTDTRWFHDYCIKGDIKFIKGRIKFNGHKNSAPFPSMIVVFDSNKING